MKTEVPDQKISEMLNRLWPMHTSAFAQLLIDLRLHFDGDLDSLVIMTLVSVGIEADNWNTALLGDGTDRVLFRAATNTNSIANISGIPRESVRRKLSRLERKKWVMRDTAGNWRPAAQAATDLRPATVSTMTYLQTVIAATLNSAEASYQERDTEEDI